MLVVPATMAEKQLSDFSTDSLDVSVSFRESGFDGPGVPCTESHAWFYMLKVDATVATAYRSLGDDLFSLAFTPEQLGAFVTKHRALLHLTGKSSFFLLKEGEHISGGIFVPYQSRYFAIRLYVFNSPYVVRAKDEYLFLVHEQ